MILILFYLFHGCFFKPVFILALTILTTVFDFFPFTKDALIDSVMLTPYLDQTTFCNNGRRR
jgi:hypothetical protein